MPLRFRGSERLSLGVELELQLLDPDSLDLHPAAPLIFEKLGDQAARIKPELFKSMVEINTGICGDVDEAREDLDSALGQLRGLSGQLGFDLASAGSHPFARHEDRLVHPAGRFKDLIDRNRWIARRLMIFGLHVHVGARDERHVMALIWRPPSSSTSPAAPARFATRWPAS